MSHLPTLREEGSEDFELSIRSDDGRRSTQNASANIRTSRQGTGLDVGDDGSDDGKPMGFDFGGGGSSGSGGGGGSSSALSAAPQRTMPPPPGSFAKLKPPTRGRSQTVPTTLHSSFRRSNSGPATSNAASKPFSSPSSTKPKAADTMDIKSPRSTQSTPASVGASPSSGGGFSVASALLDPVADMTKSFRSPPIANKMQNFNSLSKSSRNLADSIMNRSMALARFSRQTSTEEGSNKRVQESQQPKRNIYRGYVVGDSVLVSNHQSKWASLVNRFGYPPGEGSTEEEKRGPYMYVLAKVKRVHFEEYSVYYTVTREDTGADMRGEAGMHISSEFPV